MLNKKILVVMFLLVFLPLVLVGCHPTPTPSNETPILTSDPITTATVGVEYVYNVNATDPDGDILTYSLVTEPSDMTINSTNGLIKWTPTAKGNYPVVVKVSDGDLDIIQSFTIVVTEPPNQSPTASFTATPNSGIVPLEVFFDASSSYDPDGNIVSYVWDFKDGDTGSGEIVSHTFSFTGSYNVELTVTDDKEATDSTTKTITVDEVVYRVYCVGVGDYMYFPDSYGNIDLPGPPYDVNRMCYTLSKCRFGPSNTEFSEIWYTTDWDATKSNILQKVAYIFSEADYNDVSYFYFTGHGIWVNNISYLCPTEVNYFSPLTTYISVDELEAALSAIPGTKVIFLDTCHSGGFIGKGKEEIIVSQEELESFNDEIISIFSQTEYKGLLTTNQYKVLTSCHYYQGCIELYPTVPGTFDPFGVFTMGLCEGCGYSGSYPADTNLDTKVSLQEAYLYTKNWVAELDTQIPHIDITQDIQVYPENSTYPIVEY